MMRTIFVNVKQLGKKHPLLTETPITLDTSETKVSLSDLLKLLVQQQVNEYNSKDIEKDNEDSIHSPLTNYLPVLTDTGKVGFGNIYNENRADIHKAQENALQAFEDGMYAVFHGVEPLETLPETVDLEKKEAFTLIRLTFLSGSYW